jgi:hypothetical protein
MNMNDGRTGRVPNDANLSTCLIREADPRALLSEADKKFRPKRKKSNIGQFVLPVFAASRAHVGRIKRRTYKKCWNGNFW